jgi:nucleotidyltransferase substrate binding protein (TIGR01987 family)
MSKIKIQQSMLNLENALLRLKEALHEPKNNTLIIDATIQRFEFVIELYWKTLKRLLDSQGIHATTPKEVLKKAYAAEWLKNETAWLQMLDDRNETSHVYDEEKAQEIYQHIHDNFPELENTFSFLKEKFKFS